MAVVAGVDFGTLSVRVSIFDSQRGRLGAGAAEYPLERKRGDPDHATQSHADHMRALAEAMKKVGKDAPIVVFTHRPLFDLYPTWDWATQDGAKVVDILLPYRNVTVFYGHIHQENHHMTEHIAHHSAKSLMFPLPAPGSVAKKQPIPWDPAHPFKGLGYRQVEEKDKNVKIEELGLSET